MESRITNIIDILSKKINKSGEDIDSQTLATLYYLKGKQNFVIGKFNIAKEEFSQAIKLNPNYAQAYYERGLCFISEKQYLQAKEDFNLGIGIDETILDKNKRLKKMLKLTNEITNK